MNIITLSIRFFATTPFITIMATNAFKAAQHEQPHISSKT